MSGSSLQVFNQKTKKIRDERGELAQRKMSAKERGREESELLPSPERGEEEEVGLLRFGVF